MSQPTLVLSGCLKVEGMFYEGETPFRAGQQRASMSESVGFKS